MEPTVVMVAFTKSPSAYAPVSVPLTYFADAHNVTVSAVQYVAPLSVDFDTLMMKLEPVGAVSNVIYPFERVVALPIAHSNNIVLRV